MTDRRTDRRPGKTNMSPDPEEGRHNEQIKGLISNMWLFFVFFVTQYNSSLSSFVQNFRVLSQVVAEKSDRKNSYTDRQS